MNSSGPDVTDEDCRAALAACGRARHGKLHTGRYEMRYIAWGDGAAASRSVTEPVIVIHGLADAARGFAMVMHYLAPATRCIAYELPNGLDDGAVLGTYRHSDYVSDLLALLDYLGLERVALFGSSFGSTVALAAAAAAPQRFTRCVLQGGFAYRPLKWYERLGARQGRYWSGRLSELPLREFALRSADPATWAGCTPLARELFLSANGSTPIRAVSRRAVALDSLDLRPLLPSIRTPVLLIGGDRDRIVPWGRELVLLNHLPDVRRIELHQCGHYPQYTHPRATAAAIGEFLEGRETRAAWSDPGRAPLELSL